MRTQKLAARDGHVAVTHLAGQGGMPEERRPEWYRVLRMYRAPDLVIGVRVLLAFVAIGLFSLGFYFALTALVLTIVVISMDALDGYLARRLDLTSDLGAVLDITGDRIVEHVFWIYFAVVGHVPIWVPIVIVTRSFVVDTVRSMALARGMTAFGDKTMMQSKLSHFLVASRFMRTAYGGLKVLAFVMLGGVIVLQKAASGGVYTTPAEVVTAFETATFVVVVLTVVINVVRGVPVVWDAKPYLTHQASEE